MRFRPAGGCLAGLMRIFCHFCRGVRLAVGERPATSAGLVLPPLCTTALTCGFVVKICMTTMFGLVPVEECGVQWGAVGVRQLSNSARWGWR
jgi:hypothetical protein